MACSSNSGTHNSFSLRRQHVIFAFFFRSLVNEEELSTTAFRTKPKTPGSQSKRNPIYRAILNRHFQPRTPALPLKYPTSESPFLSFPPQGPTGSATAGLCVEPGAGSKPFRAPPWTLTGQSRCHPRSIDATQYRLRPRSRWLGSPVSGPSKQGQ